MCVHFVDIDKCRIVYHHRLNFLFMIIVNLITIILLFLDGNEYTDDLWPVMVEECIYTGHAIF